MLAAPAIRAMIYIAAGIRAEMRDPHDVLPEMLPGRRTQDMHFEQGLGHCERARGRELPVQSHQGPGHFNRTGQTASPLQGMIRHRSVRDERISQNRTALLPVPLETGELEARQPADIVGDAQRRKGIEAVGDRNDFAPDQPGNDPKSQQNRKSQSSEDDRNNPGAARRLGLIDLHKPVLGLIRSDAS